MRKLLLVVTAIIFGVTTYAQHLSFMGVPIDGSRSRFVSELRCKKRLQKADFYSKGYPLLTGEFAGYDVTILPLAYDNNKVWTVAVDFGATMSWEYLKYQFYDIVGKLTEKYGSPALIKRENPEPYTEGSHKEFEGVTRGVVDWRAEYHLDNGRIVIYFVRKNNDGCSVQMSYTDRINEQKRSESMMNDL